MLDEECAQPRLVDPAAIQGLVEAAMAAAEHRLQGELWHRSDPGGRRQRSIAELEEGIPPAGQAPLEALSELDQLAELTCTGITWWYAR